MTTTFPLCWCRVGGAVDGDPGSTGDAVVPATVINNRNMATTIQAGDADVHETMGHPRLPLYIGRLWAPGTVLKVGFLGGDDWQQSQVKTVSPQWSQCANISLSFPSAKPYDIIVSFDPKIANFSIIGVDSLYLTSRDLASLNLGSVQRDVSEDVRRGVILHEFGHALGATHTYPIPISNIQWDKPSVYKELAESSLKWSQEDVDSKLFKAYPGQTAHYFDDPSSIMQIAFPDSWVLDKKGSKWNFDISEDDRELMRFYYPNDTEHGSGQFQSMEVRHWNDPQHITSKVIDLPKTSCGSHRIIFGLSTFDIQPGANFRIQCSISDIQADKCTAKMDSWSDTVNSLSGMTYLDIGDKPYLQTGAYSTSESRKWEDATSLNSKRINFKKPFHGSAPKVICWITGMDFDKDFNVRIKTYASDIDLKGFTIHVDSWSDSKMYMGSVQWLAVPADQAGVALGTFNTMDIRSWDMPIPDTTGIVKFRKPFSKRPQMFMALNEVDVSKSGVLIWRLTTENTTKYHFKWHMESWWTSALFSGGASYFAWTD